MMCGETKRLLLAMSVELGWSVLKIVTLTDCLEYSVLDLRYDWPLLLKDTLRIPDRESKGRVVTLSLQVG